MKREASKTNKTVLEFSCRWEAPTSAKQVGALHKDAALAGFPAPSLDNPSSVMLQYHTSLRCGIGVFGV